MLVRPADRTLAAVAALWWLGALAPIEAQSPRRPTRILLVFQQQAETRPMVEFTQALRLTIQGELASVEFYQESLDLDRFGAHDRLTSLQTFFENKYRGFGIDVIVPVGGRALDFVTHQMGAVVAGVPVVFALTASPQTDPATLPRNVTGRLGIASRFAPTIDMARRLQPDAIQFVIVGGATPADSSTVAAVVDAIGGANDTLPVITLQGLALNTLLSRLRAVPSRSIVLFANYRGDGRGEVFDPVDLVGSIARASAAPMYTQLRSYVGEGLVGGSVTDFETEGAQTGRLILRVLHRRHGDPMPPVENIGNSFVADWRQLRHWGLSDARLPPGTEVLFREPTAWERYRAVVLLTLAVIGGESLLIGLLLLERRRRKRAQFALQEQAAYEQMMAKLTADASHYTLENASQGLDVVLERVAAFAHAGSATLVQYSDSRLEPPTRLRWRDAGDVSTDVEDAPLEIPLMANGVKIGALELRRVNEGHGWTPLFVRRMESAAEIIAGALARLHAARTIEEAKRQVAHMARVALIGELAATMSHELRQPLAAIRANAEAGTLLLAKNPGEAGEAREIFRHIVADDARAVEVIEGVRRLLRKDGPSARAVDLNETCRDAVRLLQHEAALRNTTLELSLDPTLPAVSGDPVQLQQAVLNLALNALEAASTSTSVRSVVVQTRSYGGHIEVEVHDSGPGIPPSVQAHLFESFFSTKAGGLGLGLVIVRSILERHNGRVRAENNAYGGAVFRMRLPAMPAADRARPPELRSEYELAREAIAPQ